jgi:ribonuclease J
LYLVPLGGTGEIGMNLNVYLHQGRALIVDCGVMFERRPDGDSAALYPDIRFLTERRDEIEALVLTHAHQDHLGAVIDLWPQLRVPIVCTRFVAELLRENLAEAGLADAPLRVVEENASMTFGPFRVQRVPFTHSTVEMGALILRTCAGVVLHTGDFKLDAEPGVGARTDERTLKSLRDEGLSACVADSTNAHLEGWTESEAEVAEGLEAVMRARTGRIAITLFATNIARIQAIAQVSLRQGREVVLIGRSLERAARAARRAGYLQDIPDFVDARDFGWLPKDRVTLIATGSQGEPRSGMYRLAHEQMRDVQLDAGDTAIWSARHIPGSEAWIARVHDRLVDRGIEVVDPGDALVHASGHPRREELRTLYQWTRPAWVVPVHGTPMHLQAHAELAESLGLHALRARNGHLLRLGPDAVGVVGTTPVGRIRRPDPPAERTPARRWRGRH